MNPHPLSTIPQLFILAGPNGAGKTTAARVLLPEVLGVKQFVNADNIAAGLSPFDPPSAAIQAGKIMIQRMHSFLEAGESFAFETTLAGKSHAAIILDAQSSGYHVSLIYIYLRSPNLALDRVAQRVLHGGHDIPSETVVRRYYRGLVNFFDLYRPVVNAWTLCDNSGAELVTVAKSTEQRGLRVFKPDALTEIETNVEQAKKILRRNPGN